ncbi:MAG: MFS transporter [Hyphomicrobiales bacterium]|nr:MFS transporter [Hyphomicrobiales bacterium]
MTLAAETTVQSDRAVRRRALQLSLATALAGANASVLYATASIIGSVLAPAPWLATAPLTALVIGMAFGTLPIGALARRYGRRTALLTGASAGVISGLASAAAVYLGLFSLLCLGTFFGGVYAAASQSYRFAATDGAAPALQPRLISWVLAGGVAAAFVGPQLVQHTKDFWPQHLFAATYLGQAGVAALAMIVLAGVSTPPASGAGEQAARPLGEIVRKPDFIVAALCGTVSYALMNLIMTSAPLAMKMCGHSIADSTTGIQWHVLGMYAPSFFTGSLIARFGAPRVTAFGLALEVAAAAVDLAGVSVGHFWAGLILLGIGWNFGFIGASALVVACHRPAEKTRVQSFNDFIVFGTMAVGSFSSGQMLATGGWAMVNWTVFPLALLALAALGARALRAPPQAMP